MTCLPQVMWGWVTWRHGAALPSAPTTLVRPFQGEKCLPCHRVCGDGRHGAALPSAPATSGLLSEACFSKGLGSPAQTWHQACDERGGRHDAAALLSKHLFHGREEEKSRCCLPQLRPAVRMGEAMQRPPVCQQAFGCSASRRPSLPPFPEGGLENPAWLD